MGTQHTRGFTIIETMLVLAITGVLIAGLLTGIGASIGVQRYRDSVTSLKSLVQDQYARVTNVSNDRNEKWTCDASATPVSTANSGIAPGQTDCVLLGRYLSISDGAISMATVVGYGNNTTSPTGTSDVKQMKDNYTFGIAKDSIETPTIEWGSTISWPVKGTGSLSDQTPHRIGILIVRSPQTGALYTFTSSPLATVTEIDTISSDALKELLVEGTATIPGQSARSVCINPDGVVVPERFALFINEAATGATSIETRTNNTTKDLGGTTEC